MKRTPIPERQMAICHRLRMWREKRGMTRVAFAGSFKMKADPYSIYEHGRAPLRYELACKILAAFSINAKWLATGQGPDSVDIPIPAPEEIGVSPRALFSEVYDTHLAADVERKTAQVIDSLTAWQPKRLPSADRPPMTGQDRTLLQEHFFDLVGEYFWRFPDDGLVRFVNDVLARGQKIEGALPPLPPAVLASRKAEMEKARAYLARRRKELGIRPPRE